MKRAALLILGISISCMSFAQESIDEVFRKYNGKEGYTSIHIGKGLLQLASLFDDDRDADMIKLDGKFDDLRILVADSYNQGFTDEIKDLLEKGSFISLMEVIDGQDRVNFYVQKNTDRVSQLILLAIDHNEEVLLSIKGNFTLSELAEFGRGSGRPGHLHHMSLLGKLDE